MAKLKPDQAAEKLQRIADTNAVSPKYIHINPELYRAELKSAKLPIAMITPKVVILADGIDRRQGMVMHQRIRRINELGERHRRKRIGEVMQVKRKQLVALFVELGMKAAGKWKKSEMLRHVESLPDDIEELLDGRTIWDLENDGLCRQLIDVVSDGIEIEFISDDKQERGTEMTKTKATEATPAKKAAPVKKVAATKVVAAKPQTKKVRPCVFGASINATSKWMGKAGYNSHQAILAVMALATGGKKSDINEKTIIAGVGHGRSKNAKRIGTLPAFTADQKLKVKKAAGPVEKKAGGKPDRKKSVASKGAKATKKKVARKATKKKVVSTKAQSK